MRIEKFQRACVALVSVSVLALGMQTPAVAGIVGTSEAVSAARQETPLSTVQAAIARDDVRAKLAELGVNAAELDSRLAALSPTELSMLAGKLDQAPAEKSPRSRRSMLYPRCASGSAPPALIALP